MCEIGRSIQWIDHPPVVRLLLPASRFLRQDIVIGEMLMDGSDDDLFSLAVNLRYQICLLTGFPFDRLCPAGICFEQGPRFESRFNGDLQHTLILPNPLVMFETRDASACGEKILNI